jgi:dolichol-phosphate mannosyltransferase
VARTVLGLPVRDCTTGYKCYRREALAAIDFGAIDVVGYGFLIETTYQCYLNGARLSEIPIVFTDRREGKSKMTSTIVSEALGYVIRRRWRRVRTQLWRRRHAES